ncbi:hypothetical protein PRIPAC_86075 [Pristionchus pacificus]|uniref:Zinc finger protein n=1 Tax=Pristionchus pacificus TaxID=54126 RepID=A0A2A6BU26_PRIPA|nr:hypothetical protein PRIPAC_86075 [Pristionchus pacificus]|eukprot:PDM69404.1 zinc finger protein [Pristionchus pacificus]
MRVCKSAKMTSFLKRFVNKVTGTSSHTRVSHIEGAERVCVDSSVLCCPVCYEVYASVPSLLGCGHTFCGRCVRTMQVNRMVEEAAKDSVFDCPLCRVSIAANEVYKNYIVDDLLRSVEQIAERESKADVPPSSEIVATLRLAKDRSDKKVAHLELRNSNMEKELQATKKQLRLMNLIIFSSIMGYLALEMLIALYNFLS